MAVASGIAVGSSGMAVVSGIAVGSSGMAVAGAWVETGVDVALAPQATNTSPAVSAATRINAGIGILRRPLINTVSSFKLGLPISGCRNSLGYTRPPNRRQPRDCTRIH
jgi:hypothetical protein